MEHLDAFDGRFLENLVAKFQAPKQHGRGAPWGPGKTSHPDRAGVLQLSHVHLPKSVAPAPVCQ
ncbi:UNVERIFIED_CONTAM: hypothetical protein ACS92_03400 [Bacillus cereus]